MISTKDELKKIFKDASDYHAEYIAVKISTGKDHGEIIIFGANDFEYKLNYYLKMYDENLNLISALKNGKKIQIVDAISLSNFTVLNGWSY